MAVDKNGKYTKLTEETIKSLETVFSIDGTIEEACLYANISTQTYYNWIGKNPKMKKRFDVLRSKPILKARMRVFKGIDESYQNAMDYLKRKKKSEFGDTNKIELEQINVTKKEKKTVSNVISNFLNDEDNKTNS